MSEVKPQAQNMPFLSTMNKIALALLCTPLISRGVGSRLLTMYVVGRRTGRHFSVPVAYTRSDGALLVGTPFPWGRNLRTGEPIEIRLKGARRTADVEVFTDETDVIPLYATMCRASRQFASFNKIHRDKDGALNADELHSAWTHGARAFRLTPR
jgi:hypothetical protein